VKAIKTHHDLLVWQKGLTLAQFVYAESKVLPREELYGLTSQFRRAAVSIPSNIAEGSRRHGTKDLIHFLRVADGSAAGLETQLLLAQEIYGAKFEASHPLVMEVQKMLSALIRSLSRRS
jgi:four helix bundle protein